MLLSVHQQAVPVRDVYDRYTIMIIYECRAFIIEDPANKRSRIVTSRPCVVQLYIHKEDE